MIVASSLTGEKETAANKIPKKDGWYKIIVSQNQCAPFNVDMSLR